MASELGRLLFHGAWLALVLLVVREMADLWLGGPELRRVSGRRAPYIARRAPSVTVWLDLPPGMPWWEQVALLELAGRSAASDGHERLAFTLRAGMPAPSSPERSARHARATRPSSRLNRHTW